MYHKDRRTPYIEQPITVVLKAIKQKVLRELHCIECGWPLGAITDKILVVFDGETQVNQFVPDALGVIALRCKRCKQNYKIEVAR